MWRSSSPGFVIIEACFEDQSIARLVYYSMKPDEAFEVRGLRVSSELRGNKIVFKTFCRRGLMSLAYTVYEYLQHLRMIEEAALRLEEATCP